MKKTEKKRGRGRPKLPDAERRGRFFTIRVRDDEYAELEAAAGDQRPSDWARDVLLRAARRR